MQNKNILIAILILVVGLVVGAFYGSKYGLPFRGMQSDAASCAVGTPQIISGECKCVLESGKIVGACSVDTESSYQAELLVE